VTIDKAANTPEVIVTLLIATGIGMVFLLPSLYFLFSVFKRSYTVPDRQKREAIPEEVSLE
jgi:cytochrome bd-type quinol oxidase subunit 2